MWNLSHVALYAKGWYQKTDNIWEDLIKILELDNYTPFTKEDIFIILSIEWSNFTKNSDFYTIRHLLEGIHPTQCWKVGYYTKGNCSWLKPYQELPEYDMPTAFIYYILSNLRDIERKDIKKAIPKYSKVFKRPANINLKKVIDVFKN